MPSKQLTLIFVQLGPWRVEEIPPPSPFASHKTTLLDQLNRRGIMQAIAFLFLSLFLTETAKANPTTLTIDLPNLPPSAQPLELVLLSQGEFTMGAGVEDPARYETLEWPPHPVTIRQDFYLGRFEITQAQWTAVMDSNPANDIGLGPDHPVYAISWQDTQQFLDRLNQTGQGRFRLPTEAEWEYACRADTTTRFAFPEEVTLGDGYTFDPVLDPFFWWFGNCRESGSRPVGQKQPNPWGLHDMHGNVYEWCSDWWEPPYARGPQADPQGPAQGQVHVFRGGHWYGTARHCRSAFRFYEREAETRGGRFFGFRIVRETDPSTVPNWDAMHLKMRAYPSSATTRENLPR